MKSNLLAFVWSFLFGIGLFVSGMTEPSKVMGFLDFGGAWDPSLMFVMMGAIGVHFILTRLIRRRPEAWFGAFQVPTRKDITPRLVLGAAIFGIGWGLGGYCPGPAIVNLGSGSASALLFVVAMAIGVVLEHASVPDEPPALAQK